MTFFRIVGSHETEGPLFDLNYGALTSREHRLEGQLGIPIDVKIGVEGACTRRKVEVAGHLLFPGAHDLLQERASAEGCYVIGDIEIFILVVEH